MTIFSVQTFLDELSTLSKKIRHQTKDKTPDHIARCNIIVAAKLLEDAGYEVARSENSKYTVTLLTMAADLERMASEV